MCQHRVEDCVKVAEMYVLIPRVYGNSTPIKPFTVLKVNSLQTYMYLMLSHEPCCSGLHGRKMEC